MSSSSESDVISKELQNLDLIYYNVNLMTEFLKLSSNIVGKLSPNIVKYRHLSPCGNRALRTTVRLLQIFKPGERRSFSSNKGKLPLLSNQFNIHLLSFCK